MITGAVNANTFGFNGTTLNQQPTKHGWVNQEIIGIDGNGHPLYAAPRDYTMTFDFLDSQDFDQLYTFFQAQGVTGTVVSTLPKYRNYPYQMYSYTGTVLQEPQFDEFFENFYVNVKLLVTKINA